MTTTNEESTILIKNLSQEDRIALMGKKQKELEDRIENYKLWGQTSIERLERAQKVLKKDTAKIPGKMGLYYFIISVYIFIILVDIIIRLLQ